MIGTREFAESIGWKTSTGRPHTHAVILISKNFGFHRCGWLTRLEEKWCLTDQAVQFWEDEILPEFERIYAGESEITLHPRGENDDKNRAHLFIEWGWSPLPFFE